MREVSGDLFLKFRTAEVIVIPTNGRVNRYGRAVMGAGVALQAFRLWPWMPEELGKRLIVNDIRVELFPIEPDQTVVALPTKRHWRDASPLALIERMVPQLVTHADEQDWSAVVLPRLGCGLGQLDWSDVRPILAEHLDDRFTVVSHEPGSSGTGGSER